MNRIRTITGVVGVSLGAHLVLYLISLLLTKDNEVRAFVIPGLATFLSGIAADTMLLSLSAAIPVAVIPVVLLIWEIFHPQAGDAGMGFVLGLSILMFITLCAGVSAMIGCYVGRIAIPRMHLDSKPIDFSWNAAAIIIAGSTGALWWLLRFVSHQI